MTGLIDTHAHIYDDSFANDIAEVIERAKEAGVQQIYMPNIDSSSIGPMLNLEERFIGFCVPMMGIHPCYINSSYKESIAAAESWLEKRRFCAIGEIGIDLYWDKTFIREQQEAFVIQLGWAKTLGVPVAIHCRESLAMVIDLVKEHQDGKLRGVFHCFVGSAEQAATVIDLGFLLGIGGVSTFKNGGIDAILPHIGLQNLVLETDSPYLAPTPHRGKRNEPSYLQLILKKVAESLSCTQEEVKQVTSFNANKLFTNAG